MYSHALVHSVILAEHRPSFLIFTEFSQLHSMIVFQSVMSHAVKEALCTALPMKNAVMRQKMWKKLYRMDTGLLLNAFDM